MTDIETIRLHCIAKVMVEETFPFGDQTLVFKVAGKMFCLMPLDNRDFINLKCDPEYALELREKHPEDIQPGWHMSKTHWNTVALNGMLPTETIVHLINHSYDQVVSKLTKKVREEIHKMQGK